jgi:hypothetical protein
MLHTEIRAALAEASALPPEPTGGEVVQSPQQTHPHPRNGGAGAGAAGHQKRRAWCWFGLF